MHPIDQRLIDDGWRKCPDHLRERNRLLFCKSFDGHAECKCNERKRKQIEIYHYQAERIYGHQLPDMWRVDCVGQLPDNEWLRMNIEGLQDIETIYRTVDQLLRIWDFAVSIAPTIEEPE